MDYTPPPIMKPPPAVVKFAEVNNVTLFANACNIKTVKKSTYHYKEYKFVFPCFDNNNVCAILYKTPKHIRFATTDELNQIYWDFR